MLRHQVFLWLLVAGLGLAALKLPAKPGNDFLADYANVINVEQTKSELRSDLKAWNAQGKSRLFIVTVSSLNGYGLSDVAEGSKTWSQAWGLDQDDVLFLFSVGDRKAWIQTGAEWGAAGEARADEILRETVMPPARNGDYSLAVFRGANALHRFMEPGPGAVQPAGSSASQKVQAGIHRALPYCDLPWPIALGLFSLGSLMLIMGVMGVPRELGRPVMLAGTTVTFLATAFSTVALPVFGIILLIGLSMLFPSHHHHCHSWFGWGSSHHNDSWFGGCGDWFDGLWGGGCSDRW